MIVSPDQNHTISIMGIELALVLITIAAGFAWPHFGSSWFSRIETAFGRLARKRGLAVAAVGFSALLVRGTILPLCPAPVPSSPDDFSNLLAADTFAHGRLTNPTPAMWRHFETIQVDMQPTYMSMYFPGAGLVLAAGKVSFGNPWIGILCTSALMCAGFCWMLQGWLPPTWALLGGVLAILRLGLFSYWINTYTGGGVISSLGGALVLGALPRLTKTRHMRYGLLMAAGIDLLVLTRPYEGLLLCLPIVIVLGRWALFGKNRPTPAVLLRRAAMPMLIIVAAIVWMGYGDYRSFGSPFILPYTINRATYAVTPYFVWQSKRPDPVYRHEVLRAYYHDEELNWFNRIHSVPGFFQMTSLKAVSILLFFAGFALLPPLIMLRRVLMDRRIRFLVMVTLVLMAGMAIEIYVLPHYLAPFTAAFYAIGLQAMRHLRHWRPESRPAGLAIVRLSIVTCFVMVGVRLIAPLHIMPIEWPTNQGLWRWFGPANAGLERAQIEADLDRRSGNQLVIVRYTARHSPFDEWVANEADIDGSKIVWAQEMSAVDNLELLRYYKNRQAWLVEPDLEPAKISPYPIPEQLGVNIH